MQHHMQSFKTIDENLLVPTQTKFSPASLLLTLSGDLTWIWKSHRRCRIYNDESTSNRFLVLCKNPQVGLIPLPLLPQRGLMTGLHSDNGYMHCLLLIFWFVLSSSCSDITWEPASHLSTDLIQSYHWGECWYLRVSVLYAESFCLTCAD